MAEGTFVVAGATGNVGLSTVQKLSELGGAVRALSRSATGDKAARLKELVNVEVLASGECFDLPPGVFDGVKGAFLACSNCKEQVQAEKNFIDSAVAAGCSYLVKLGTVRSYTALDSPVEYGRYHAEIEEHLQKTAGAMKWTVLCPGWFMTNHLGDIFGSLPAASIVPYPVEPTAQARINDPRDVGDIAARLLLASDTSIYHELKLDISGPELISTSQIAEMFTEALGRPVQAVKCTKEDWIAQMVTAGFPEWLAEAVSNNFPKWEKGALSFPSSPEILALAPPQRTMSEWIKEWAPRSPPPAA